VLEDLGLYEAAFARFELQGAIAREIGSLPEEAFGHAGRAALRMRVGDFDAARREIDEGLRIVEPIRGRRLAGHLRYEKGDLARLGDRPDVALEEYEGALALMREVGDRPAMAWALAATGRMLAACGERERGCDRLVQAFDLAQEIGKLDVIVHAACLLALLRDEHVRRAVDLIGEHGDRMGHGERMEARFLLWRATRDVAHLEAAHRLLEHAVAHAPAGKRETMIAKVPLHRDIMAAWAERGGEAA
jgi:tetratricopeptide (TPR) repeat protein